MPSQVAKKTARRSDPSFLLRGLSSGILSTVAVFVGGFAAFGSRPDGMLSGLILGFPMMAAPGLIFGLLIGRAIGIGLGAGDRFTIGFPAASTGCCWVASLFGTFLLGATMGDTSAVHPIVRPLAILLPEGWMIGAFCGLIGTSALAVITRRLLPDTWEFKRWLPISVCTVCGAMFVPLILEVPFLGIVLAQVGYHVAFAVSFGASLWER